MITKQTGISLALAGVACMVAFYAGLNQQRIATVETRTTDHSALLTKTVRSRTRQQRR